MDELDKSLGVCWNAKFRGSFDKESNRMHAVGVETATGQDPWNGWNPRPGMIHPDYPVAASMNRSILTGVGSPEIGMVLSPAEAEAKTHQYRRLPVRVSLKDCGA
jgi:hypothetical protein